VAAVAAETPKELSSAFAAAMARGDVDAALAMWADDAVILAADGAAVRGRENIRAALAALVDHGTSVEIELGRLHRAGDVAVATGSLTLSGAGVDGPFEQRSESTVVYARGADGLWRIALDAPWGLPPGDA